MKTTFIQQPWNDPRLRLRMGSVNMIVRWGYVCRASRTTTLVRNAPHTSSTYCNGNYKQLESYFLGQRFSDCFVLKFALQRGEGRKGRECKFQSKAHRTLYTLTSSMRITILFCRLGCFLAKFSGSWLNRGPGNEEDRLCSEQKVIRKLGRRSAPRSAGSYNRETLSRTCSVVLNIFGECFSQ